MKIPLLSILTAFVASAPLLFAQENERKELFEILKKAESAQAEGRPEEAEKLRNLARKQEIRQALHQTEQELEAARKAGNAEAVKNLEGRMADIRAKAEKAHQQERERERWQGEKSDQPRVKLRHLREAIEHLRLAGLHDPANSLAEQAEKMEQSLREGGRLGPGDHGPQMHGRPATEPRASGHPDGGLRAGDRPHGGPGEEVMKLQQQVRELSNRLERLERRNQ